MSKYLNKHNLKYSVAVVYLPTSVKLPIVILACLYSKITLIFKTIYDEFDVNRFDYQFNELLNNVKEIDLIITDKNRFFMKEKCRYNRKNFFCIDDYKCSSLEYKPNRSKKITDFILMTSGTTSSFKAVQISLNNFKNCFDKSCEKWNIKGSSISLCWTPHSHIYGLINGFLLPMYSGSKSIILSPKDFVHNPVNWLRLIYKYKVTNCYTTSYGIDLCNKFYQRNSTNNLNFISLKHMVISGEFISNNVLEEFLKLYSKFNFQEKLFSPTYGMTENSGFICSHIDKDGELVAKLNSKFLESNNLVEDNTTKSIKIVSSGTVSNGTMIYIVDDNNNILEPGKIGEIVINSPGLTKGYLNSNNNTSFIRLKCPDNKQSKKFFKTGDYGGFLKKQLFIVGRKKEIINIKGKKYSPYEIENVIIKYSLYKIEAIAIFAIQINFQENVVVFIELNKNDICNQESIKLEIKKNVKEKISLDIFDIVVMEVGKIPRTDSGKLKRKECEAIYKEHMRLI